ncbi:two-component system response regulator [Dokdonia sp. MED134]|uniref:LytR/AlgR family response regulator transcription factor n=1 Tax=Dokdonia sp. MED134 TaxID=313590 RepID=UPI000068BFC6|nr:LytTR family DNA-binding domain-containing protein [Dokdonia sp. MED134]EAQ38168.1 two-component system response regulator [Dokdonia sp. MED134]
MSTISCIIIDDEELARTLLETYVEKVTNLHSFGSFQNPIEALSFIKENPVDLIFLDIQMPELKGTEFASIIATSKSKVIFTTAYSEYALKGFELNALDYLLKPITFNRFLSAVEKFPLQEVLVDPTHLVIKSGYDLYKIVPDEVRYIESDSEYVNYHLETGKKIIANQSLSKLIKTLPTSFLRVHRSFIVNGNKVTGLKGRDLIIGDKRIPVSDSYYDTVKKSLFN